MDEAQRIKLVEELDAYEKPEEEAFKKEYALIVHEFMMRVRDKLDNGNTDEVTRMLGAADSLSSIAYAINVAHTSEEQIKYITQHDLVDLVDTAVEKVYDKLQVEERNAVARKLKATPAD